MSKEPPMARHRKPKKRDRDGIAKMDTWTKRGPDGAPVASERWGKGMRWVYRAWDAEAERYKSKSFADEAAGQKWAMDQLAKFTLKQDSAEAAPLLSELAKAYIGDLEDEKLNERHIGEVKRVLASLVASGVSEITAKGFVEGVKSWRRKLKAEEFNQPDKKGRIVRRRLNQFGLSPLTINRYMGHVRAVTRYAVRKGKLLRDPLMDVGDQPVPKSIKPTFTVAEIRALVSLGAWDNPAWVWGMLMAFTGCRDQEALHLRWEWVDWDGERLAVKRHPDYSLKGNKERTMALQSGLAALLKLAPNKRDIGWIVSDAGFRKTDNKARAAALSRVLKDAEVTMGERTPHSFRHTFAAVKAATREDSFTLSAEMGHSDLHITKHYAQEKEAYVKIVRVEGWKPGELRFYVAETPKARGVAGTDAGKVS
jgi:integrase